jgi:hypothetical protein
VLLVQIGYLSQNGLSFQSDTGLCSCFELLRYISKLLVWNGSNTVVVFWMTMRCNLLNASNGLLKKVGNPYHTIRCHNDEHHIVEFHRRTNHKYHKIYLLHIMLLVCVYVSDWLVLVTPDGS